MIIFLVFMTGDIALGGSIAGLGFAAGANILKMVQLLPGAWYYDKINGAFKLKSHVISHRPH